MPEAATVTQAPATNLARRVAGSKFVPMMPIRFHIPDALIALAILSLGGHEPALPGRN